MLLSAIMIERCVRVAWPAVPSLVEPCRHWSALDCMELSITTWFKWLARQDRDVQNGLRVDMMRQPAAPD